MMALGYPTLFAETLKVILRRSHWSPLPLISRRLERRDMGRYIRELSLSTSIESVVSSFSFYTGIRLKLFKIPTASIKSVHGTRDIPREYLLQFSRLPFDFNLPLLENILVGSFTIQDFTMDFIALSYKSSGSTHVDRHLWLLPSCCTPRRDLLEDLCRSGRHIAAVFQQFLAQFFAIDVFLYF